MLAELNRFLTADNIREEYGIPAKLFGKLLPVLPWHFEQDGRRYYLESRVDAFLDRLAAEREGRNGFVGLDERVTRPDGPAAPDVFWLDGERYKCPSADQWRLLRTVWEGPDHRAEIGTVLEVVYGEDSDREDALDSLRKRVNRALRGQGCPAKVSNRGGYFTMERTASTR